MSKQSVIDKAIEQMQQKMADSRGKRTGDYRIGLDAAINIVENLRDLHKEQIEKAWLNGVDYRDAKGHDSTYFEIELGKHLDRLYYNETYGGNK